MSTKANSTSTAQSDKMTKAEIQQMNAFDRKAERQNAANHKKLAFGIAELIAQDPRVEWEIVSNWLRRHKRVAVLEKDLTVSHHPGVQPKQDRQSQRL